MTEQQVAELIKTVKRRLPKIERAADLSVFKAETIGRQSALHQALAQLGQLPPAQRKAQGSRLNQARQVLEQLFSQADQRLQNQRQFRPLDVTQPSASFPAYGHLHPTSQVLAAVQRVFSSLGYSIVDGPEIETDWYNFEVLNMPPEHPAREMQDTFYLQQTYDQRPLIPRTHTSGMQVRYLEQNPPPVKIVVPGRVYRNENEDRTHAWIFTQMEGLVVGEGVSMADLKGTLDYAIRAILGPETKIRLRPSFFPYTEPSVEVDAFYGGEWLELLGGGMVHPQVLVNAGVDAERFSGFAFGVGLERLSQVKFQITDLRLNWRPNLNFLEHF